MLNKAYRVPVYQPLGILHQLLLARNTQENIDEYFDDHEPGGGNIQYPLISCASQEQVN
jgi:hypothetical protein